jgi:ABC-type proline/glycine betaine transport system permease subunit
MTCNLRTQKLNAFGAKKLNAIVERKGLGTPIFKGFMADGA